MGHDKDLFKITPTVLRMDRRICKTEVQCCWYDRDQDGEPCTESVDNCDYIQMLISEAELEAEAEKDIEIEDLRDQVESREAQMAELEAALKLDDTLPALRKQLVQVSEQLSVLEKQKSEAKISPKKE